MPKLPDKKQRPWIPKRERKQPFDNNAPRSSADMMQFYNSKAWRSLRNYWIQMNPLCQKCESKGLTEHGMEVDHITAIKDNGAMLSLQNLQTLCRSCHAKKSVSEREARKHTKKYY